MEPSRSWCEWDSAGDMVMEDDDFDFDAAWFGDSDGAVAAEDGNINNYDDDGEAAAFAEEVVDAFLESQPGWNLGREVRPCYHPTKKQDNDDDDAGGEPVVVSKTMTDTSSYDRSEEEADADLFLSSHLSFMSSLGTPKRAAEEEQDYSNLFPTSPLFMDDARPLDTIPETSWSSSIEEKEINQSNTDDSTHTRDGAASALTDNSLIQEPSEDLSLVPNESEPFEVREAPATSKDSVMLELIQKPRARRANASDVHYLNTIQSKFGSGVEHHGVETRGEHRGSGSLGLCLKAEQTSDEEDLSLDDKGKSISIYSFHNNLGISANKEQSGEEDLLFNEEKKQEDSAVKENSMNSTDFGVAVSHTDEASGAECPVSSDAIERNKQSLSPAVISQTSTTDYTNRSETLRGRPQDEPDNDCENSTDYIRIVTPRCVDHRTTNDIRFPIDEVADTFMEGAVYIFEDSHCRSSTASLTSQHSDLTAEFYQYNSNTRNVDMAELYVARERFRPVLHELVQRAAHAAEHRADDAHPSHKPWLMLVVMAVFFGLFRLSSIMAHCNNSRQTPLADDQCSSDLFLELRLRIIDYETGV